MRKKAVSLPPPAVLISLTPLLPEATQWIWADWDSCDFKSLGPPQTLARGGRIQGDGQPWSVWEMFWWLRYFYVLGFPGGSAVKNPPINAVWSLGWEDPLEKVMTTHSSILAREILWTEESGGLQSMGSQKRVEHSWTTKTTTNNMYVYRDMYVYIHISAS